MAINFIKGCVQARRKGVKKNPFSKRIQIPVRSTCFLGEPANSAAASELADDQYSIDPSSHEGGLDTGAGRKKKKGQTDVITTCLVVCLKGAIVCPLRCRNQMRHIDQAVETDDHLTTQSNSISGRDEHQLPDTEQLHILTELTSEQLSHSIANKNKRKCSF